MFVYNTGRFFLVTAYLNITRNLNDIELIAKRLNYSGGCFEVNENRKRDAKIPI